MQEQVENKLFTHYLAVKPLFWPKNFLYFLLDVPSNAHISTPFFQKTVFFSKICFGDPPSKFLEVCLNSDYMW